MIRFDPDHQTVIRRGARPTQVPLAYSPRTTEKMPAVRDPAREVSRPDLPPVTAPTLGIWSTNDHYLDGERMEKSGACVAGPWRHEVIPGASHWIPIDAPGRLNELLLDWLR